MKQVFVAHDPMEAHLVRGLLEASGIAAVVQGDILFNVRGETPVTSDTLPTVWVLDDGDATQAMGLLADYGRTDSPATLGHAGWICPRCGERIEAQFTECWSCGAGRP